MRPITRPRLIAAVVASLSAPLLAADFTWNGNGGDALWSNGANWQGGVAPPPASAANNLIFGASLTALAPLVDDAYTVGRVSFQSVAGYNVGLAPGGSLRVVGGNPSAFSTGVFASFGTGGTTGNAIGAASTIGAPFTSDVGLVYVDPSVAAGTVALTGAITSTGSGVNSQGQSYGFGKIGAGRLILAGDNNFANGFEARNGVLGLSGDGAAGRAGQTLGVTTGNAVTIYNTSTTPLNVAANLVLGEATTATVRTTNFGLFSTQLTTYGLTAGQQGNLTFNGSVSTVSSNLAAQQVRLDVRTGVTTTFNGVVTGNRYNKVGGGTLVFGPASNAGGVTTYDAVSGVTVVSNASGPGQNLLHGSVDGQVANLAVPTGSSVTLAQPVTFTAPNPTLQKPIVLGAPGYNGSLTLSGPVTLTGLDTAAGADASVKPIGVSDNTDATISGAIGSVGGNFGISKFGNGTLTLSGLNTYTGYTGVSTAVLNISDNRNLGGVAGALLLTGTGTLRTLAPVTSARQITTNSTIPATPPANFVPGKGTVDTNGFDSTFGPVLLSGTATTGEFVKSGAGRLNVTRSATTGVTVNAGTLAYSPKATPNLPSGQSRIVSLAIADGAALDVSNNLVVLDTVGVAATPTSPAVNGTSVGSVRGWLRTGFAGGAWTGPGINASTAAASPRDDRVGYATSAQLGNPAEFLGVPLGENRLLLATTVAGDADLNLSVAFADLVSLAQNYGATGGATWFTGDFDYDGAVAFADLVALAQNYGGSLNDAAMVQGNGSFHADWALAQALVPEPTLVVAALGGAAIAARRRRP